MNDSNGNIVILGGGYGGAIAAARVARRGIGLTLVDARDGLLERIRLHQVVAGDDIPAVPYRRLFRNLPVNVVRARVTAIDRAAKRVITDHGPIAYDRLVYALGSENRSLDPRTLRERLRTARTVAVIGGGLTGIETAAEVASRHRRVAVTLVDSGRIGAGLSDRGRRHLHGWMAEHGVTVIENHRVAAEADPAADLVVWCTSFALSPIAAEAGLEVNERGQIVVDAHLRSSDPSIFAVGDAAAVPGVRMSCAAALPMGAYVADVLSGATREPFRFGYVIQCISLGRDDGIIQFVNPDDSPREMVITGRPAAWLKELVCRFTITAIRLEARGIHYRWPQPHEALAA